MGKITDLITEARTQASLSHQNIAIIYTVDIDDKFIAMEFIEGQSVDDYLKKHIISKTWIERDKAIDILSQCFEGLIYAHDKSVVHGDIKPANLMIHSSGSIKIMDFGVAKVISEEQRKGYPTNVFRRLGSLTYIAPEVLRGEPRNFKSDIFSLGIVAYLLFTGNHPFFNPHPSGLFSVREMLISDQEAKNPREIDPDITERHASIIMKMLAKNPDLRYSSIKQAYEEFVEITLSCPKCHAVNPLDAKFCNQCSHSLKEAKEDKYKGMSPQDFWGRAFKLNSISQFREAIKLCDEAIKLQDNFADAYQTKGFALSSLGEYEEALRNFEKALEHSTKITKLDQTKLANIHTNMSYCYERMRKYDLAKLELEKALEYDPSHYKAVHLLSKGKSRGYW
jgi:serine/threonine protein kinase